MSISVYYRKCQASRLKLQNYYYWLSLIFYSFSGIGSFIKWWISSEKKEPFKRERTVVFAALSPWNYKVVHFINFLSLLLDWIVTFSLNSYGYGAFLPTLVNPVTFFIFADKGGVFTGWRKERNMHLQTGRKSWNISSFFEGIFKFQKWGCD